MYYDAPKSVKKPRRQDGVDEAAVREAVASVTGLPAHAIRAPSEVADDQSPRSYGGPAPWQQPVRMQPPEWHGQPVNPLPKEPFWRDTAIRHGVPWHAQTQRFRLPRDVAAPPGMAWHGRVPDQESQEAHERIPDMPPIGAPITSVSPVADSKRRHRVIGPRVWAEKGSGSRTTGPWLGQPAADRLWEGENPAVHQARHLLPPTYENSTPAVVVPPRQWPWKQSIWDKFGRWGDEQRALAKEEWRRRHEPSFGEEFTEHTFWDELFKYFSRNWPRGPRPRYP
jgi:hypothetical protein